MDRAWFFITTTAIILACIYLVGIFTYENIIGKALNPAGGRLAPYGIEIFHLR